METSNSVLLCVFVSPRLSHPQSLFMFFSVYSLFFPKLAGKFTLLEKIIPFTRDVGALITEIYQQNVKITA